MPDEAVVTSHATRYLCNPVHRKSILGERLGRHWGRGGEGHPFSHDLLHSSADVMEQDTANSPSRVRSGTLRTWALFVHSYITFTTENLARFFASSNKVRGVASRIFVLVFSSGLDTEGYSIKTQCTFRLAATERNTVCLFTVKGGAYHTAPIRDWCLGHGLRLIG